MNAHTHTHTNVGEEMTATTTHIYEDEKEQWGDCPTSSYSHTQHTHHARKGLDNTIITNIEGRRSTHFK